MSLPSPDDIQGDIVHRMLKKVEDFIFFRIDDPAKFRAAVPKLLDLQPATGTHIIEARNMVANRDKSAGLIPLSFFNIGFSKDGLQALGIDHTTLCDPYFSLGQLHDSQALGDTAKTEDGPFVPDWEPAYLQRIDGVVLVTAESDDTLKQRVRDIEQALGDSICIVHRLHGKTRPKELCKHEHFGWKDGISNPAVPGLTPEPIYKGQRIVPPGILLVGAEGDPFKSCRPAWAVNGSFMVFRQLNQLVPEFKQYLKKHPVVAPGLSPEAGKKLRCAWFFGRWPSGTPLELSPTEDDPKIADDPNQVNDFVYSSDQERCPYAAHIRKVNPRNMLPEAINVESSIMRTGIAFGDEVKDDETTMTKKCRGLAFVAYQSVIDNGFRTQQTRWANNQTFPPNPERVYPGFDAIIGQVDGKPRATVDSQGKTLQLPSDFVVPRGGGYFFMPSIPALKDHFSPKSSD